MVHGEEGDPDDGASRKKRRRAQDRILSAHEIDALFLQRQLSSHYDDANVCAKIADDALDVINMDQGRRIDDKGYAPPDDQATNSENDLRECENKLLVLIGFELFDLIKVILNNRVKIWACISLKRAKNDADKDRIESILKRSEEGKSVWDELHSKSKAADWTRERMRGVTDSLLQDKEQRESKQKGVSSALDSIGIKKNVTDDTNNNGEETNQDDKIAEEDKGIELDLQSLAFRDGNHTMSNQKCDLPDKSWRAMKKGYEEVHVPAVRNVVSKDEHLVLIKDLPKWTHDAFKGMESLNRIQSKLYAVALKSSENILLCAPTGADKTNVAMLTMMNILGQYRKTSATTHDRDETKNDGMYDLASFKIVYVAPMKALVQEVVKNFSKRLAPYGVNVRELSGDSNLTRQQISETQLLVTTPKNGIL